MAAACRPATISTSYVMSWTFSILLHGLVLGSVIMLMADFRPAPRPEPFKWDVSVLEPSPMQPSRQSVQPQPRPTPAPQVEQAPNRPQPVVEAAQETIQQEVRTATPFVQTAPQPDRSEPQIIARTAQPIETPPPAAREQPAATAPTVSTQPATATSTLAEPAARTPEPITASTPGPASTARTKRDYGWLTETLWSRIEQLKRYPSLARLNRWEGKVVVRAVIKETGDVTDLRIAQSSGYDILDQDALEILKQAAPLQLKQSLGQPQIVVHIPISYKLNQ